MKLSKSSRLRVALGLSLLVLSCNSRTTIQTSSCSEVQKQEDKASIIAGVDEQLALLAKGIAENNAELIFGIFSKTNETTYAREGFIYEQVSDAERQYAKGFKHSNGKRKFEFTKKQFDILNSGTVFFTGIGALASGKDGTERKIAYTLLWVLEPVGWRATNMHISWTEEK